MEQYKVILVGPNAAGKTTAIQSVSDDGKVSSERVSGMSVDYGVATLSPREQVHLYGLTGEGSFGPIGDALIQSASAAVILLDNRRNNPFRDMKRHMVGLAHLPQRQCLVVGITHCDSPRTEPLEHYQQWAQDNLPVMMALIPVDARNKTDILGLLTQALASCRQSPEPERLYPVPATPQTEAPVVAKPQTNLEPPHLLIEKQEDKKLLKKLWNLVYLE